MTVTIIPCHKAFGDYFEQYVGLETKNDDGTFSPTELADYGFVVSIVSNGVLKTIAGVSLSAATMGDLDSFDAPTGTNKADFSWLKFSIAADASAKVPAKSVLRRYRAKAYSTANPTVVTTTFEFRVTEE